VKICVLQVSKNEDIFPTRFTPKMLKEYKETALEQFGFLKVIVNKAPLKVVADWVCFD